MEKKQVTNRCNICEKRYKLPKWGRTTLRDQICTSCESQLESAEIVIDGVLNFWKGLETTYPRDVSELVQWLEVYKEIKHRIE